MAVAELVYFSESGFTERYVRWLTEATSIPMSKLEDTKALHVGAAEDLLVLGAPVHGGELAKRKQLDRLVAQAGKARIIVLATGAALPDSSMEERVCANTFSDPGRVSFRYLPGGFDADKLSGGSKALLMALRIMLKHRRGLTEDDWALLDRTSRFGDFTDRELLGPLVSEIEEYMRTEVEVR